MIRFIVKNKYSRYLFIVRNRSSTDTVFLFDENDSLLLDEYSKALVD